MAYILIPLSYCYIPFLIKFNLNVINNLLKFAFMGCYVVAIFCILEFLFRFYLGFDIASFLFQAKENYAFTLTNKGHVLFRSRAFSTEPIITGLFLSVSIQYLFLDFNKFIQYSHKIFSFKILCKIFTIWIFIIALLTTGSASSIIIICSGLSLIFLKNIFLIIKNFLYDKNNFKYYISIIISVISLLPLVVLCIYYEPFRTSMEIVFDKISMNSNYGSVAARTSVLNDYFSLFLNDPFGLNGSVGRYSKDGSAFNWYLTLLGDLGLLGTLLTLLPLILSSFLTIKSTYKKGLNSYDKFSLLFIPIIGLIFHGTFYASPLWPLIIVVQYL
tara:strand:- start:2987 stop:3976 length:990 start_codon:yes stop_codon:yes gene_type:complete